MDIRQDQAPACGVGATDPPPDIKFDIALVHGDAGRRLAPRQAEAILTVLSWLCEQPANTRDEPQE
jgi:hypothetical protein